MGVGTAILLCSRCNDHGYAYIARRPRAPTMHRRPCRALIDPRAPRDVDLHLAHEPLDVCVGAPRPLFGPMIAVAGTLHASRSTKNDASEAPRVACSAD